MAYVPVPKDLSKVKTKVAFNLTKRQIVCFAVALIFVLPLFFLLKSVINTTAATLCMILVMLPFFLLAMYERPGQPLAVIAGHIIRSLVVRGKERPYQTNNFYAAVERQARTEKEVMAVVRKAKKRAASSTGGKTEGKADKR